MSKVIERWGTFEIGRWGTTMNGVVCWNSSADSDPYKGLRLTQELKDEYGLEWFDAGIDAKNTVNRLLVEYGDDIELNFSGTNMRVVDKINEAVTADRCRLDPIYFVEHYKTDLVYPNMYRMIAELVKNNQLDFMAYLCVHPGCNYVQYKSKDSECFSIKQCRSCGRFTQVNVDLILEYGDAPDAAIMTICTESYNRIKPDIDKISKLVKLGNEQRYISLAMHDYRPALRIGKNMPGISVKGEHFIRGRVNREVLKEGAGLQPWPGERPDDLLVGQDEEPAGDLMLLWFACDITGIHLLEKVINEPKTLLDPSKAAKFREEYIDSRWDTEFASFVKALIDKGTLAVDSSGVSDTLTTLYHLAQRKSGKKTVIRKNGKIKFPTKEVLENISPDLIKKAFAITEHAAYADPQQVFRLGEAIEVTHE